MKTGKFPSLKIGSHIAKVPIVQGGMGIGISLAGLAVAVANEGGIGVIATAGVGLSEPDFSSNYLAANIRALKKEIRAAREKTRGVLGVNIMVALSNFGDMVKTSIAEGIDVIFSGGGLPLDLPQFMESGSQTSLVPIVSSGRAAKLLCKRWSTRYGRLPDAFVVEGPMAGGHLGFKPAELDDPRFKLENLVTEVVEAVGEYPLDDGAMIPVIAAGGVYTGEDIAKMFKLGASGVQLGTRFVTTKECNASEGFKQTYIDAVAEDIVVIESPVGMPGRAIRNQFLIDVAEGKRKPYKCPYHCIRTCDYEKSPYCIFFALINAQRGKFNRGFAFAGSNAWRATEITTVKQLMDSLAEEYAVAVSDDESVNAESSTASTSG